MQNSASRANSSEAVGNWNYTLSKDVLGDRAGDVGIRLRFMSDLAPVQQAMSLWFAAIDKEQYSEYRSRLDFLVQGVFIRALGSMRIVPNGLQRTWECPRSKSPMTKLSWASLRSVISVSTSSVPV